MSTLTVFMGLTGSMRKEKAEQFANEKQAQFINIDDIRSEFASRQGETPNNILFEEAHRRVKALLDKGIDVVFDATNLISRQRKDLISKMKNHTVNGVFVLDTIETCMENDQRSENPLSEADFIIRVMTTNIPFQQEGWNELSYIIEESNNLLEYQSLLVEEKEDEAVFWARNLYKIGKPYLNILGEGKARRIGYGEVSAYLAFQILFSLSYDISFIEEVVELIVFKKRAAKGNETEVAKVKELLGEEKFKKLEAVMKP